MSTAESSVLGAAALAVENLDELIVGSVQEVHTSITRRVFGVADRIAGRRTLAHRLHGGISAAVYAGIGASLRGTTRALRAADEAGLGPSIEESPKGRFALSVIHGFIGDSLPETHPRMTFEMGVRHDGRHVRLEPDAVAASYPDASDAIVVFVHGLCETEDYWLRRSRPRRDDRPEPGSYGRRLSEDEGWSPVFIRANTGLGTAESGAALSAVIGRLVEVWPTEVRRIALVGHSMGGLIIRRACAVATPSPWVDLVSDVVTLGTPHLGSPVERSIARGLRISEAVPELAAYRRIFSKRSAGVLELSAGITDLPGLPHVNYRLVAASLTGSSHHPVALGVGDLLVQPRSAFGTPRHGPPLFPGASTLHVPRADHFDLLNHEAVYAAMRGWLRHRGPRPAALEEASA